VHRGLFRCRRATHCYLHNMHYAKLKATQKTGKTLIRLHPRNVFAGFPHSRVQAAEQIKGSLQTCRVQYALPIFFCCSTAGNFGTYGPGLAEAVRRQAGRPCRSISLVHLALYRRVPFGHTCIWPDMHIGQLTNLLLTRLAWGVLIGNTLLGIGAFVDDADIGRFGPRQERQPQQQYEQCGFEHSFPLKPTRLPRRYAT
jgi:hypothetical protein